MDSKIIEADIFISKKSMIKNIRKPLVCRLTIRQLTLTLHKFYVLYEFKIKLPFVLYREISTNLDELHG